MGMEKDDEPSAGPSEPGSIRRAARTDLDGLLALEAAAFPGDRMSRASFRSLLGRPSALTFVAEDGRGLLGYALVLFRRGARVARLYSIAVDARARGRGLAQRLLDAAEEAALERGAARMSLEVREDNAGAIRLYEARGYRKVGRREDYYEDHAAALRYARELVPPRPAVSLSGHGAVPYHPQTTEFTCGPAVLMMALAALAPATTEPGPALELALWREATCVFLINAPGGCDPLGLALAAARRGLRAEVYASHPGPYFVEVTRGPAAREIMTTAQAIFREEAERTKLPIIPRALTIAELVAALDRGAVAALLISPWLLIRSTVPHWVLAIARTERAVIIHDPYRDPDPTRVSTHESVAIPFHDLERMAVWGKTRLRAAVILEQKTPT